MSFIFIFDQERRRKFLFKNTLFCQKNRLFHGLNEKHVNNMLINTVKHKLVSSIYRFKMLLAVKLNRILQKYSRISRLKICYTQLYLHNIILKFIRKLKQKLTIVRVECCQNEIFIYVCSSHLFQACINLKKNVRYTHQHFNFILRSGLKFLKFFLRFA